MSKIDDLEILRNITEVNSWWISGNIKNDLIPEHKRNAYIRIKNIFLNEIRRFPVLSGPRRVGKSTIMFQLIDELLNEHKVSPSQIIFYTFDDFPNGEFTIKDVLRIYKKYIYPHDDFYFFVDEAQKDSSWKSTLKMLFDLNKKARVMISGSSSLEIDKTSDESGAARFYTIKLGTFSFYEFCKLNHKEIDIEDVDVFKMYQLPTQKQYNIYSKINSLFDEFIRYLKIGGFPEYASSNQYSYISKLIRDQIVIKTIHQDIPSAYKIRDVDGLSNLYLYLCYHSSEIINVETISKNLGIDRATCNQYIEALEKSNLIYISSQTSLLGKKALKPKRKVYISDNGIRIAITRHLDVDTDETQLGLAIESIVFKHTYDYFINSDEGLYNVGFFRNETGKEVDISITLNGNIIQLIESKYRFSSKIKDNDGIILFGLNDKPGYIISKNNDDFSYQIKDKTSLYWIPAIAYIYLLGKETK